MKSDAAAFLAKSHALLDHAPALLLQDFTDEAGRAAYLAGFHAAQALTLEKTGRSSKPIAVYKRDLPNSCGVSPLST